MGTQKRLVLLLAFVLLGSFFLLGFFGREVYRQAPPIPAQVKSASGELLMTRQDILDGQRIWQRMGGQQVGSIWGHGAYQAPDWSADWLHREAMGLLQRWSHDSFQTDYEQLDTTRSAALQARLRETMRDNRFDAATDVLVVGDDRSAVGAEVARHYDALFSDDPAMRTLRERYALHENAVPDAGERRKLSAFFFWTAWACATERPHSDVTYTNNWPHEPLIDNVPSSANVLWSVLSVMLLIAGIGGLVWFQAFRVRHEDPPEVADADPLDRLVLTPSMRATGKYVVVVVALVVVQCLMGAATAHYTVEGQAFFGYPLAEILPYSVTRTWHMQLAVFWIATAFLTAGLFLAPAVGGHEPRFQRLGVNVLFGALLLVVVGSLFGVWAGVQGVFDLETNFYLGHQGYEFVELGRVWQYALFVGLLLWLTLMLRALWPALRRSDERSGVVWVFAGSAVAIGLFYGAGFRYQADTHLSVMEYWRWWVVHLWVEGFMEVFTTAAIALFFTQLGLLRARSAGIAVTFSTAIFLVGGIPGTFHHLYFSGTPVEIMAVGATFSALEVVPLVLIGMEAFDTARMAHRAPWMARYRWPIRFFVAVAFWNFVGAGVFGFLINPPLALFYVQGLNTTAVHAHTALFGVYGMLALGLLLVVMRRLRPLAAWNEGLLAVSFWSLNGGLTLMVVLSLLPVGLLQMWASLEHGFWYARSAEFLQQPLMQNLRWARMVGDTAFLVGVLAFALFTARALRGPRQASAAADARPADLPRTSPAE